MTESTITLMKYRVGSLYGYKVFDKFDEPDEALRLDKMMLASIELQSQFGDEYEQLWIKNTVII